MTEQREADFADELVALLAKYRDLRPGTKSAYLFTAIAACVEAQFGRVPTAQELGRCTLSLLSHVAKQGQVSA